MVNMLGMFLVGCVAFGVWFVVWLVQECKSITDEELDQWIEMKATQKFTQLVEDYVEVSKSIGRYLEYYMPLPQEKVEQYSKVRDELFAFMENKPYLPQGLVESVYSLNQSNNNLFRAYDIDINIGA